MRSSLVIVLFSSAAFSGEPTATDFNEQLQKLKSALKPEDRVAVAKWIAANGRTPHSSLALDAMEKLIADDADGKVRQAALSARFQIARQKQEPCPLSIVRALRDPVDEVRWTASMWAGIFKTKYADGSLKLLIDAVQDERAEVRSNCMYHLGDAANKDAKAIEAIERAKKDKDFDVRLAAHMAAFRAKDDLNEYLRYLIRLREDPESLYDKLPPESDEAKGQLSKHNMLVLGSGMTLAAMSENRPEELAKTLNKLLDDKSPIVRRGAASMIAGVVRRAEKGRHGLPEASIESLSPYIDGGLLEKNKPPKPPFPSKAFAHFKRLKTPRLLAYLAKMDEDAGVRVMAESALKRISELAEPLDIVPREVPHP